jgi:PST family polysaccharide transporter
VTLEKWYVFADFLKHSTATQAISAVNWQMDQLLLGKFVSHERLGSYSMASTIASLPYKLIESQATRPLLGAFSLIRNDRSRLQSAYQISSNAALLLAIPTLVGLALLAKPILLVALGEKWVEAGDVLRWLCVVSIPPLFAVPLSALLLSLNQTGFFWRLQLFEFSFRLPLMVYGVVYYGIAGVLFARLVSAIVMTACSMFIVRHLTGISIGAQLLYPWRTIISSMIMTLFIYMFEPWLELSRGPILAVKLSAVVATSAVIYAAAIWLLWRMAGRPEGIESRIEASVRTVVGRPK